MGEDGALGCGLGGKEEIIGLFIPAHQNGFFIPFMCSSEEATISGKVCFGGISTERHGVKNEEGVCLELSVLAQAVCPGNLPTVRRE